MSSSGVLPWAELCRHMRASCDGRAVLLVVRCQLPVAAHALLVLGDLLVLCGVARAVNLLKPAGAPPVQAANPLQLNE